MRPRSGQYCTALALLVTTACFDPEVPSCLPCTDACPSGQDCVRGRCQAPGVTCPAERSRPEICGSTCRIGGQTWEDPEATPLLWLDWTSLRAWGPETEWLDRSRDAHHTETNLPSAAIRTPSANGGTSILTFESGDRHVDAFGLQAPPPNVGVSILLVAAQSCDGLERGHPQCILTAMSDAGPLRLCFRKVRDRDCRSADPGRGCDAFVPPTDHCDTLELLTLRWRRAADSGSTTELRRDGEIVWTQASDANLVGTTRLRIGGTDNRPFLGELALAAVLSGNLDDERTCRLERFVLRSLHEAGLRDEVPNLACE